jgi:hypothetical protein
MSPSGCRITAHVEACRRTQPWTREPDRGAARWLLDAAGGLPPPRAVGYRSGIPSWHAAGAARVSGGISVGQLLAALR